MSTLKVTTRTFAELTGAFEAVFKDIHPVAAAKPVTQADRLEPYRKLIMKQRRRGLNWKQIAAGMGDPRIGEKVGDKLLRKLFGATSKAVPKAPAAPSSQRFFIDPATGQEVTPQAAPLSPPAPVSA